MSAAYVQKLAFAAEMRAKPSPPEALLWAAINRNQVGYRINRQQVILGYIADFYCPSLRTVIEVDGKQHADQLEWDVRRDQAMQAERYSIMRIEAHLVFADTAITARVVESFLNDVQDAKVYDSHRTLYADYCDESLLHVIGHPAGALGYQHYVRTVRGIEGHGISECSDQKCGREE